MGRTSRRTVYMKYSEAEMCLAVDAVLKRNISVRKASLVYRVPFSTLYGRIQTVRAKAIGGMDADLLAKPRKSMLARSISGDNNSSHQVCKSNGFEIICNRLPAFAF